MADNDRLSELIAKIKRTEELNAIDFIEYIDLVENNQDGKREYSDLLIKKDIKEIVQGYKIFPLYLIKYIFTIYPKTSSSIALDHIVTTKERRSDLMECILTAFSIKLCDIPDITFDCRMILAHRTVSDTRNGLSKSDNDTINNSKGDKGDNDNSVQDMMDVIEAIESCPSIRGIPNDDCNCMDRRHWYHLYDFFMGLIEGDDRFMFESYNVNYSITNLVAQTDVANERLSKILVGSIDRVDRWRSLLIFIKKTGLVSSAYGDMIFSIRDAIILNDRGEINKDPNISRFKDRVLLSTLLKRYNQYHENMSMITDNVYITDINGARNTDLVRDKGVDCIVSLTKRNIFQASNVRYFHIKMDDMESVDFLSGTLEIADQIIELIQKDQIILVHCYKGVSRSVSFVVLVLVKQGMTYEDAFNLVKSKRHAANPNPAFRHQLKEYSRRIHRK